MASFANIHLPEYSRQFEEADVEIPNVRVRGIGLMPPLVMPEAASGPPSPAGALRHAGQAWFRVDGTLEQVATRYYERAALKAGNRLEGPAIVNQYDSTTVIPPGTAASTAPCAPPGPGAGVGRFGQLGIETGGSAGARALAGAKEVTA